MFPEMIFKVIAMSKAGKKLELKNCKANVVNPELCSVTSFTYCCDLCRHLSSAAISPEIFT
jgi:hypothetical protein